MYHSLYLATTNGGGKNTWTDWNLVASSRPVILPPEVKLKTVDIPGGDGVIDLTESLTGYPVYKNRTGSIDFIVVNDFSYLVDTYTSWVETYQKVLNHLHGKKCVLVLEDDPYYYYEGRLSVTDSKSYRNYTGLTIDYDLGPYKWHLRNSQNVWLADPFGVSSSLPDDSTFTNIAVTTTEQSITVDADELGYAPISPVFSVSSTSGNGITLRILQNGVSSSIDLPDGDSQINGVTFGGSESTITYSCSSGTATLNIIFRKGAL